VYLNDDTIYNPRQSGHLSTRKLNELLMQKLFPYFYEILSDNDPIPLYGLKLLSSILEKAPSFIRSLNEINSS